VNIAVKYVKLSQICLYGFLTICTFLTPRYLFEKNEGGISNFGIHQATIIPYTLAFGLGGLCLIIAAKELPIRTVERKIFYIILMSLGILLFLVLISTYFYKINRLFDYIHVILAELYFLVELVAGLWFVFSVTRNFINILLYGLQFIGFIMAVLTVFGYFHFLFLAQIITGLSFAIILVRTVSFATSLNINQ
jgi:hypothetical protein